MNSTAGQQALWRGLPLRAFGAAVYAKPEFVSSQPLEAFFAAPDRPEYQRAIVSWEGGRLVARSTGAQGSSRLLSLRGANALLLVPGDGQTYAPGAELDALLTGPIE